MRRLLCVGGPQHGRIVEVSRHASGYKFPRIVPDSILGSIQTDLYTIRHVWKYNHLDIEKMEYLGHESLDDQAGLEAFLKVNTQTEELYDSTDGRS
jgi:hypothetical protein